MNSYDAARPLVVVAVIAVVVYIVAGFSVVVVVVVVVVLADARVLPDSDLDLDLIEEGVD